jgi:hemerythrin superfamily protein
MADAYELLSEEHRAIQTLFRHYAESGDAVLAHEIIDALRLHDEVEAQALYPEIRRFVDDGDDLAQPAEDEHARMRAGLVDAVAAEGEEQRRMLTALAPAVEEHIGYEERALFPAMREAGVDADALARALEAARGEAPSRSSGEVG